MDFFWVSVSEKKIRKGVSEWEVSPEFNAKKTSDLMTRGKKFYAVWDPDKGMWSQSEYDLIRMVDQAIKEEADKIQKEHPDDKVSSKIMRNFSSNSWIKFLNYVKSLPDNYVMLDGRL